MRAAFVASILTLACASCRTVVWYGSSPGRARRVEVVESRGRQRVVVDGASGPEFDAVAIAGLAVLDGGATAYAARLGPSWYVIWKGVTSEPWEGIGDIAVSEDGTHVAYAALRDGSWCVVVDGRVGPALDALFAGTIRISRAGLVAYAAERAGRAHVVVGERLGPPCDAVASLVVSPDGAHVAWVAREGRMRRVLVDGVAGPGWDDAGVPVWLGGARLAYAARRGERWWVVVGAEVRGPYDAALRVRAGPRGDVTYVASRGGAQRVVAAGVEGRPLDEVGDLAICGDHVGYVGRIGGADHLVVDGIELGSWPRAAGLALDPEGRWAIVARDARGTRVVHDRGEEAISAAMPDTLTFVPRAGWGVAVADRSGVLFAFEGGEHVRIDAEEIVATAMRAPDDPDVVPALLRRWIRIEGASRRAGRGDPAPR